MNKFIVIGPGGLQCPCCAPPRGKRKSLFRSAKRKEKIFAMKVEETNIRE